MNRTDYPAVLGGQILACEAARNNEIVGSAGLPGIAELHALYSRRLYKTIVAITKNHEDAEDILQDTFLRAHLALHTFEGRSSIYSWLTRIAMNAALMILRKRRARAEILFDPQPDSGVEAVCFEVKDTGPNPEEACDLRRRQARLLEAIGKAQPGTARANSDAHDARLLAEGNRVRVEPLRSRSQVPPAPSTGATFRRQLQEKEDEPLLSIALRTVLILALACSLSNLIVRNKELGPVMRNSNAQPIAVRKLVSFR